MTWLVSAVHPKLPPPGSAQVSASSRLVLEKFRLTADGAHTRPRSDAQLCLRLGSQRWAPRRRVGVHASRVVAHVVAHVVAIAVAASSWLRRARRHHPALPAAATFCLCVDSLGSRTARKSSGVISWTVTVHQLDRAHFVFWQCSVRAAAAPRAGGGGVPG